MADYDVIVVGAGGAGLAAAVEASANGASVLLTEAGERVGGSTILSAGVIYAAGSSVQQAAGITDSPEAMFLYCMAITQNRMNPALARRLCDDSAGTIAWLQSLGVAFDPMRLYAGGLEPPGVMRSHRTTGSGSALVGALEAAVSNAGVDIARKTRVGALAIDPAGTVGGIRVGEDVVTAGAVVLATGGFGNDRALLERLYPDAIAAGGDWSWYMGAADNRGDGLIMAEAAGAAIAGENRGLLAITHGFDRDNEVFHPGWLVFVNRSGRRFMREFTPYGVCQRAMLDQPGQHCFAIFDEAARLAAAANPLYSGLMAQSWTKDTIADLAARGRIATAPSVEALATHIEICADTLASTVAQYNSDCDAGHDSLYAKERGDLRAIRTAPFYAAEMRPATVVATFAGVSIDREARAIDRADRSIPGLYAAGEAATFMTEIYVGGGHAVSNALTFGRIAGRNAARYAGR